ncbi:MAG: ribosome maturation factor RimP [Blastocatellia bacterium]|nr:ribosome maturation factor RimP [Chloracidobacterium sp.]MBL8184793.1 ribosome maturation factor RimP [Blastocatellia bacterium]HBE81920.1 hypothetical protein [Blastocatellia bacterium]HRJ87123.1 ribosome maturation factor RimP [Pyrinomonadaceae bacterium]HRK51362.1 ribosome maturation factor RimP [Pyrinomonadaceae bacterium]
METSSISQRIRQIAMTASSQKGLEFVHAEVAGTKRNPVVRVFVDKPGGVTVEDCGELSRSIEAVLDADDFIPSAYVLEVSSPGLERELYSLDDFKKFIGRKARIKTTDEIDSRKAFKGTIETVEGDEIVFSDRTADVVRIPYGIVKKANLVFDIADDLRKG